MALFIKQKTYPLAPGVAAGYFVRISQQYPWLIGLHNLEFKPCQWNRPPDLWMSPGQVTIIWHI